VPRCGVGLGLIREGGSLRRGERVRGHLTCTPAGRSEVATQLPLHMVLGDQHEPALERLFAAKDGESFLNVFLSITGCAMSQTLIRLRLGGECDSNLE
jgi:hypothetical protein